MRVVLIGFFIAILDQLTKHIIRSDFAWGESRPIIDGFFNLTYVRNTGAAWGLLGGMNWMLTVLSIVILAIMVIFRRSFLDDSAAHKIAFGLMVGGIVGNFLDRVRQGWVTDFLDFYVGTHHWPSFNVADSAICVGVGIYVVTTMMGSRSVKEKAETHSSDPDRPAHAPE